MQLQLTAQPTPGAAVIAGDALFDLRSALDHIAVALVPSRRRSKASFPIESEPIWKREHRRYVVRDSDRRRRFREAVNGMPDSAIAIIERLQPYHGVGQGVEQEALYQLSRLNNADKHRQLVVFSAGLLNTITDIHVAGTFKRVVTRDREGGIGFAPDGANIHHLSAGPGRLAKSDVKVQVSGTPIVAIDLIGPRGNPPSRGVMDVEALFTLLLDHIPRVLTALEPYVRPRSRPTQV